MSVRYRNTATIDVYLNGSAVPIDESVFRTLLDNSVAGTYVAYAKTLQSRRILYSDLVFLAEKGEIPFSLFFAPISLVEQQVKTKTDKLLAGVNRDTFSIGSRAKVDLRDIELIIKDLIRKQQLVRKHDTSLKQNPIIGVLRDLGPDVETDASKLMSAIGLSHEEFQACKTRAKALDLLIDRLEANQVFVSRSVPNYMPQKLNHVKFSGLTVRDNKVPYIFLAGGDHKDDQEPTGRTIFTLTLMTVLVARRIFAPMTWDGGTVQTDPGREYDIAGAMLMPKNELKAFGPFTLAGLKTAADRFNVTPSAITVRAMRLGMISSEIASNYLDELREEFRSKPNGGPRNKILPENGVQKYNGRELTRRMLRALDNNSISPGEFCRSVCLNRIRPIQIEDLRRAIG